MSCTVLHELIQERANRSDSPAVAGNGCGHGGNGVAVNTNLAYTRFLFVIARNDDDAHGARLRTAGANIARGFFNDFDIDDNRETQVQAQETIQFLIRETDAKPLPGDHP